MIAALVLLLATAAPGPGDGVAVRAESGAPEAEFGTEFPVTVTRTWDRGATPPPWSDGDLAPLVLRPLGVQVREAGGRVEETRRFGARAFRRGAVRTAAHGLSIRVLPSVDPKEPGPPEWTPPLRAPRRIPWALVLALAAGLALLVGRLLRPHPAALAAEPRPEPGPDARAAALRRIEALRARESVDPESLRTEVIEAAEALRAFLDAGHGVPAPRRTTAEVLDDARTASALGEGRLPRLRAVLARADLAKFALDAPSAADLDRLLEDAGAALGGTDAA